MLNLIDVQILNFVGVQALEIIYMKNYLLNSFKHRFVKELAWVIASPPLVSGLFEHKGTVTQWWSDRACLQEFMDCLSALQSLDENPQTLIKHLEGVKSKRLGLRFEALIAFWLKEISPNFTLLAQNIQLNEIAGDTRSRTIGEVDFIIKEQCSGKVIHLEVAVKFYLGAFPFNDPYRWFGTNTNDQLGKKVDHLQYHQTQLLVQHGEQIAFAIDERHCFLKGRLFYPLVALPTHVNDIQPQGVARQHLRGHYVVYGENNLISQSVIQLEKSDWLATLSHVEIEERSEQRFFSHEKRAYCYALIEENEQGKKVAVERLFCLPDDFIFPQVLSN